MLLPCFARVSARSAGRRCPRGRSVPTTKTFTYTGAEQTFKVPGGVHGIQVLAVGGHGGATGWIGGGEVAEIRAGLTVTPGETLYIEVGGRGGDGSGGRPDPAGPGEA